MVETIIADLQNSTHSKDFLKVLSAYAEDPMGGGAPLPDYTLQNLIPRMNKLDNSIVVLCYCDEEVAGMANCFIGFSSFKARPLINIHDFAIVKKFRGKGLSKVLLDKVEEVAKEKECCKITLEVLENNHRAKHVYKTFGFEGYELNPEAGKAVFWQKNLL